jgi:hypothetical protein
MPIYVSNNNKENEISQLGNKMCSHCLFPVVDKSENKVDEADTLATS